jgi:hypothetical protein
MKFDLSETSMYVILWIAGREIVGKMPLIAFLRSDRRFCLQRLSDPHFWHSSGLEKQESNYCLRVYDA